MVKPVMKCRRALCFFMLTLAWLPLGGVEVKIATEIDPYSAYADQPLSGTVMVTHDQNQRVDGGSFYLDKEALAVDFVKEVALAPPVVISIYNFHIPGKAAGLYALPPISVLVGGKKYWSSMSSYTVAVLKPGAPPPSAPAAASVPNESRPPAVAKAREVATAASLRLEAGIAGPASLYPGQRTKLYYRYFYSGDIDLTVEQLPLLDAKGLIKIGEKEIKDYTQGELSVSEIGQEVEGVTAGDYVFGPSLIEGYAYSIDALGKHIPSADKLTSSAPAVTVTVLPFPTKGQPLSFNGAVGKFEFKVTLQSAGERKVGEELALVIDISGQGNLRNVPLPSIARQPGFSGFFRFSDLPPVVTISEGVKQSLVRLRPLTADIKEIPSIEFSFFDPDTGRYTVLHSPPLPLTVKAADAMPQQVNKTAGGHADEVIPVPQIMPTHQVQPVNEVKVTEGEGYAAPAIEIKGIFSLKAGDVHNYFGGTWLVLVLLPLGIALLIYQRQLCNYLESERLKIKPLTTQDLMRRALAHPEGSAAYFEGISLALRQALCQTQLSPSMEVADEELATDGLSGKVRVFLLELQAKRFAGKNISSYAAINSQAQALLKQIQEIKPPLPAKEAMHYT